MRRPHTDNSTAAWGCSRRVMSHRSVVISGFRPYRNQFPPTIWSENDFGWMVIQLGRLNIWFTSNTVSTSEIITPERNAGHWVLYTSLVTGDGCRCSDQMHLHVIRVHFCVSAFPCDCRNFGWYTVKKISFDWLCLQSSDVSYNESITDRITVHITCCKGRWSHDNCSLSSTFNIFWFDHVGFLWLQKETSIV